MSGYGIVHPNQLATFALVIVPFLKNLNHMLSILNPWANNNSCNSTNNETPENKTERWQILLKL